jgi:hypothetical protein
MDEVPGGGYKVRMQLPAQSGELGLITKVFNR